MNPSHLRTARLILRPWRDDDLPAFTALNADPRVMEFFPARWSPDESAAILELMRERFAERGFGVWAAERIDTGVGAGVFVGMLGLSVPSFPAPFTPCVEILWRLRAEHWGQGLATEGARAALSFGFDRLGLDEIVAFTTTANARSRRVMEKLGMHRAPAEDFLHPGLPDGHPLRPHVLYRARHPRSAVG